MIVSGTIVLDRAEPCDRFSGDLGQAVDAEVDAGGIVLCEGPLPLIRIRRSGRAEHEAACTPASGDQSSGRLAVHEERLSPVRLGVLSDACRCVKHVGQVVREGDLVDVCDVADYRHDSCTRQAIAVSCAAAACQAVDRMVARQALWRWEIRRDPSRR